MKPQLLSYRLSLLTLLFLALAQFACGLSAPSSGAGAQQVPTNPPQANPTASASTQVIQPTAAVQAAPTVQPTATIQSERGTPDEAKTMLQRAVDHYNSVGRDHALADFNAGTAPFIDRDLYVACIGPGGIITANGGFPQYVGLSADVIKDADGNPVGTTIWNDGSQNNEGSITFLWINPVSNQIEPKIFFYQKVGSDVCGVGAYNP
jgi:cytochrome c